MAYRKKRNKERGRECKGTGNLMGKVIFEQRLEEVEEQPSGEQRPQVSMPAGSR